MNDTKTSQNYFAQNKIKIPTNQKGNARDKNKKSEEIIERLLVSLFK